MKGIYIVGGYPDLEKYVKILELIKETKIDFVEIGLPFNDPIADGPIIAKVINKVVKMKYSIDDILIPATKILTNKKLYIMTYANIVYNFNFNNYLKKIQGLIIADCPNRMQVFFYKRGLKIPIIPFATINSNENDLKLIKKIKADFVYFIGIKGTTGGKLELDDNIFEKIRIIRESTGKNVIFGFGIKNKNIMNIVLKFADGCVIGTEIVKNQYNLKNFKNILKNLI